MRLLVTWGSNFLGGYVVAKTARRGHLTVALARSEAAASTVVGHTAQPLTGDFDGPEQLPAVVGAALFEALVNLVWLGSGHASAIAAAARQASMGRVVLVSITAVTTSLPPQSKQVRLAADQEIRHSGLKRIPLRPPMIYGILGNRNLTRLLTVILRVPVLPVPGGGRHLQQSVHVADVADAVLNAVKRAAAAGHCFDVVGPEPLSFADLLRICALAVGSRARLIPVPLASLAAATPGYEMLSARPRIRAAHVIRLAEYEGFAIDDAVRDLDYAPRPFTENIQAEACALGLANRPVS